MLRNLFNSTLFLENFSPTGAQEGRQEAGWSGNQQPRDEVKGSLFSPEQPGLYKVLVPALFRRLTPPEWREASAEAAPSPSRPRGAELGLAPTELRGRCRRVGGRREGLSYVAIKGRPGLPGPCTRWKAAQS